MKHHLVVVAAAAFVFAGCVSSTPVAPAPISAEDAPKLSAALVGGWQLAMVQDPGGRPKADKGIHFTFSADGKLRYRIDPIGEVKQEFSYHLEGRNIVSDGLYKTMRVDEWNDGHLVLFIYDTSKIFHCTRERPA